MLPEWFSQLGLMAYPLACCSVLAVAVFIERAVFFARMFAQNNAHYHAIETVLTQNKSRPKPMRDELVSFLLTQHQREMFSGIKWLRIVGVMSPMLGLLGTVLGMIVAFKAIAGSSGPVNPNLVANGLWEAMLTTAVGLAIALPSLLMAHIFKGMADRILEQWQTRLNQISLAMEGIQFSNSGEEKSATPAAPIKKKAA